MMHPPVRVLTLSILALNLCVSLPAQQRRLEFRAFDLSFISGVYAPDAMQLELPLKSLYTRSVSEQRLEHRERALSIDRVVDLVRESIAPESWGAPGASLQPSGLSLHVRNVPAVLDEIGRYLAYLEQVLLRPSRIEVYTIPAQIAQGERTSGVLAPDQVDRLLADGGAMLIGRLSAIAHVPARLKSGQLVSFAGDYDVEVAQGAEIADPVVFVLNDGFELLVELRNATSGGVIVRASARQSGLEELRVMDTGSTWVGKLQLPEVDVVLTGASALLEDGGGLVVGSARGASDPLLLLRLRSTPLPVPPSGTAHVVWPAGAVELHRRRIPSIVVGRPRASGDEGFAFEADFEHEPFFQADRFLELVRVTIDPEGWDSDPRRSIVFAQDHIFLQAPPEVVSQAAALLSQIERSSLRNVSLELRVGRLDAAAMTRLAGGQADLASVAGLLEARSYVTVLAGDSFRATSGRELAYLQDHNVEIAQDATIAEPIVKTLFNGVTIDGTILEGRGADQVVLVAELTIQDIVGDIVPLDLKSNDIGLVEVPRTSSMDARITERLPNGRWVLLHLAPRPAQGDGLAILARARF